MSEFSEQMKCGEMLAHFHPELREKIMQDPSIGILLNMALFEEINEGLYKKAQNLYRPCETLEGMLRAPNLDRSLAIMAKTYLSQQKKLIKVNIEMIDDIVKMRDHIFDELNKNSDTASKTKEFLKEFHKASDKMMKGRVK